MGSQSSVTVSPGTRVRLDTHGIKPLVSKRIAEQLHQSNLSGTFTVISCNGNNVTVRGQSGQAIVLVDRIVPVQ